MLCCFAIMAVTGILYFVSCLVSNKHRDRVHGQINERPGMEGIEADLDNSTDRENNRFRYAY